MPAFPRTVKPSDPDWPRGVSPLQNVTQANKTETRPMGRRGVSWTETWGHVIDTRLEDVAELLESVTRWHELGTEVTVTPFSHLTARGTATTGAAGAVDGAGQTGTSLVTDGWSNGVTFKQGDYVTIAGVKGVRKLAADATANGSGQVTLTIHPQLVAGSEPADDAVVTLNGPITAKIHDVPSMPAAVGQTDFYLGLVVRFRESV